MDPEEFYDSLDESCNSSSASLNELETIKDESIPFYKENFCISQIDVSKDSSGYSGCLKQSHKTFRSRRKISIDPLPKRKKSYLEIFYNKMGVNKYEMDELMDRDSLKPTRSNSSPKSYKTCDGDIECDRVIDVDLKSHSYESWEIKNESPKRVPDLKLQMDSGKDVQKFFSEPYKNKDKSLSPNSSISRNSTKNVKLRTKLSFVRSEKDEIVLSKWETWKRRQQYGIRASETNRIQFNEQKALKSLGK